MWILITILCVVCTNITYISNPGLHNTQAGSPALSTQRVKTMEANQQSISYSREQLMSLRPTAGVVSKQLDYVTDLFNSLNIKRKWRKRGCRAGRKIKMWNLHRSRFGERSGPNTDNVSPTKVDRKSVV